MTMGTKHIKHIKHVVQGGRVQSSQPSYAKFALRSSLAVFIGFVFSGLFAYVVRATLARVLSVTEYGLFYAVFSFVSFFLLFRDLGLGVALIKYVADN